MARHPLLEPVAVACGLQTAAAAMAPVCAAVAYSRQGDLSVTRPQILPIDELGYLPLDKRGAVLLFRSSKPYERGSIKSLSRPAANLRR
jgi:hypothetical protein